MRLISRSRQRREDDARALAALELVSDGVVALDEQGSVRIWNGAAARITGVPADEAIGRRLADVLDGWSELADDLRPRGTFPAPRSVRRRVGHSGSTVALSARGTWHATGSVFAFRNGSEESELDRVKSDFIATAAHELRTPVAELYGAAATLIRRHEVATGDVGDLLQIIDEQSERLWKTTDRLITMASLQTRRLRIAVEPVDAREMAELVAADAKALAPADFEIGVDAPATLPPVLADPERLRQVLLCVFENAIKYSLASASATIDVACEGGTVVFRIHDEGIGVPAEDETRIFESFYRGNASMSRGVGGAGLGLAIVREITEQMGGRVGIESRAGRGSAITIRLPAAPVL